MIRAAALAIVLASAVACGGGRVQPAPVRNGYSCEYCRMTIEDSSLAAQLAAAGEESKFFDDVGCMAGYLKEQPGAAGDWVAFVADHRTKEWVAATDAVFTRVPELETPMGSNLIAHSSTSSRDADADARGGVAITWQEIIGSGNPKRGAQ